MSNPKVVIILSGKRKSGKDYLGSFIEKKYSSDQLATLRIAGPIKAQYAKDHQLDYSRLLDASEYKEYHREQMVKWSEAIREKDPNYFLRLSIENVDAIKKPIWMLTDARRFCDIEYFKDSENFRSAQVITVRITALDEVRTERGWIFTNGIDDKTTECGLDEYKYWDFVISNNNLTGEQIYNQLIPIFDLIDQHI